MICIAGTGGRCSRCPDQENRRRREVESFSHDIQQPVTKSITIKSGVIVLTDAKTKTARKLRYSVCHTFHFITVQSDNDKRVKLISG